MYKAHGAAILVGNLRVPIWYDCVRRGLCHVVIAQRCLVGGDQERLNGVFLDVAILQLSSAVRVKMSFSSQVLAEAFY